MSTHLVHPPGVAALERWGLLERLVADRLPAGRDATRSTSGPFTIAGSPQPIDGIARGYCPRRTVLDKLLVDAAAEAGAELREGFTVEEILARRRRGDRASAATPRAATRVTERARGRDRRRRQALARWRRRSSPSSTTSGRRSWRCTTPTGATCRSTASRPRSVRRIAEAGRRCPTHDDLTVHARSAGRSRSSRPTAATSRATSSRRWSSPPSSPSACAAATRESKFIGSAELPGYFRKPFGPGWALRRRRRLPQEPDHGDGHQRRLPRRRAGRRRPGRRASRAAHLRGRRWATTSGPATTSAMPVYEFTDEFAQLQPPPPEMQQLIGAMHGNQEAMDGFVSVQAATLPAPEFFAPENVGQDHGRRWLDRLCPRPGASGGPSRGARPSRARANGPSA